jgi:folate-dependent phosphoribosylglycinamide formyltransferase PurN
VVVTAAYSKSLHAIALLEQLARAGHTVPLALEVSVFNWGRVRFYARQLGWTRFIGKIRARLADGEARDASAAPPEVAPMLEYVQRHGITSRSIADACRKAGAVHRRVSDLNEPAALDALRAAAADLVVYAGGGILRRAFIETPRLGVLNAHGGPLPEFRGMNAAEWALFYGRAPTVTIHYIDTGVDTGPMLFQRQIAVPAGGGIPRLRGEGTRAAVEALLDAVERIARGAAPTTAQRPADGRQHFVMAPPLLEILERWLAGGRTPRESPAS